VKQIQKNCNRQILKDIGNKIIKMEKVKVPDKLVHEKYYGAQNEAMEPNFLNFIKNQEKINNLTSFERTDSRDFVFHNSQKISAVILPPGQIEEGKYEFKVFYKYFRISCKNGISLDDIMYIRLELGGQNVMTISPLFYDQCLLNYPDLKHYNTENELFIPFMTLPLLEHHQIAIYVEFNNEKGKQNDYKLLYDVYSSPENLFNKTYEFLMYGIEYHGSDKITNKITINFNHLISSIVVKIKNDLVENISDNDIYNDVYISVIDIFKWEGYEYEKKTEAEIAEKKYDWESDYKRIDKQFESNIIAIKPIINRQQNGYCCFTFNFDIPVNFSKIDDIYLNIDGIKANDDDKIHIIAFNAHLLRASGGMIGLAFSK